MIRALNFKSYDKGSLRGFFDLGYGGLIVKGCRLMTGNNGLWVALPSNKVERDGETKYVDIVELTKSEMDHVRKLVIADLEQQGHLERSTQARPQATSKPTARTSAPGKATGRPPWITPDGEDLSDCYAPPQPGGDSSPW